MSAYACAEQWTPEFNQLLREEGGQGLVQEQAGNLILLWPQNFMVLNLYL